MIAEQTKKSVAKKISGAMTDAKRLHGRLHEAQITEPSSHEGQQTYLLGKR